MVSGGDDLTDDYHVRTIENATDTTGLQQTINLDAPSCRRCQGESLGTPPDRVDRPVKAASRGGLWMFGLFGSVGKEVPDGAGLVDVGEPRRLGIVSREKKSVCDLPWWYSLLLFVLLDQITHSPSVDYCIAFACNCYILS